MNSRKIYLVWENVGHEGIFPAIYSHARVEMESDQRQKGYWKSQSEVPLGFLRRKSSPAEWHSIKDGTAMRREPCL